jgi:hypothetical protein
MDTMTKEVASRNFAGVFDIPISESDAYGIQESNEAIGGHYGIAWKEYFRDAGTGEVYSVHCRDGVHGGKGAYSDKDEEWRQACYYAIIERSHQEAGSGATVIKISRNERILMQGLTHKKWLETAKESHDGQQSQNGLDGGSVGECWGIPIICDLQQEDNLPAQ